MGQEQSWGRLPAAASLLMHHLGSAGRLTMGWLGAAEGVYQGQEHRAQPPGNEGMRLLDDHHTKSELGLSQRGS